MKNPQKVTVRAWTQLIRAHGVAFSAVEKTLKDNKLPPLVWYDILFELEQAGHNGLRPYELEQRLLLPQYGISRLINRIEKAGYLERNVCEDDGRGQFLQITCSGRKLRQDMWQIYGPAIDASIGEKLSQEQQKTMSGLLDKLIT